MDRSTFQLTTDKEGRIIKMDDDFPELVKYDRDVLFEKDLMELIDPIYLGGLVTGFIKAMNQRSSNFDCEAQLVSKDGRKIPVKAMVTIHFEDDNLDRIDINLFKK